MTIDEAIEILSLFGVDTKYWKDNEGEDALNLGIEALKEVIKARDGDPLLDGYLLPGETEE